MLPKKKKVEKTFKIKYPTTYLEQLGVQGLDEDFTLESLVAKTNELKQKLSDENLEKLHSNKITLEAHKNNRDNLIRDLETIYKTRSRRIVITFTERIVKP